MNELIALLIFVILSLAWQLISDEPWTRINRRAEMVVAGAGSLGWVVERILSNHITLEGCYCSEMGETIKTPALLDVIDYKVGRLKAAVATRRERTAEEIEHWGEPFRPDLKYKVMVYVTRVENGRGERFGAKAGLMGVNLLDTLAAFTGHAFTPQEIAGLELKQ